MLAFAFVYPQFTVGAPACYNVIEILRTQLEALNYLVNWMPLIVDVSMELTLSSVSQTRGAMWMYVVSLARASSLWGQTEANGKFVSICAAVWTSSAHNTSSLAQTLACPRVLPLQHVTGDLCSKAFKHQLRKCDSASVGTSDALFRVETVDSYTG